MFKPVPDTFLYFAYGSNLLKKRIHINNASAVFLGTGKLECHKLDFIRYTDFWGGASATIIPHPDYNIWGAVWRIHNKDLAALDQQEGVNSNWYFAKSIKVITMNGEELECRTYQQAVNPPITDELPMERRPSITYLQCIIDGAIECQLPESYIEKLKNIPHNGKHGSAAVIEKLKK